VGGTSLGANTTLEVAALAPARLRGLMVEMPVLDNALRGCAIAFTPLYYPDVLLDWVSREPGPSAAILQGIFFGRTAPPREERKTFEAPTLILGHPRDAIHPFSDAKMLSEELPNGRLVEANSLFELRLRPRRLTGEIAAFLDECWRPRRTAQRRRRASA
jgi:pimeloyl-ACP methyl ester carboxylesterase